MLFRKQDGTFIEIIRYNYKNDEIYYKVLMELMVITKNTVVSNEIKVKIAKK